MKVYFDTNVFIDIAEGDIDRPTYEALKKCLARNNICAYYTPITFNEVVENINFSNRAIFHKYIKILLVIKDLCGNHMFEYPEYAISNYIWNLPNRNLDAAYVLNRYRDVICSSKSYQALAETNTFKECRKLIKEYLKYRKTWVKSVNKLMNEVNPNFKQKREKGKSTRVINRKEREKLLTSLIGQDQKSQWIDATIIKSTPVSEEGLIGTPDKCIVKKLYNKLSAYFKVYENLGEKVINDGYVIKESDYNDIHLLIYLGKGDNVIFISQDNPLHRMIANCSQNKQMMNLQDFMESKRYQNENEV